MPASSQKLPNHQNQHLSQSKDDLGRHLRSASPAVKRPASDMGAQDRESYNSDVEMGEGQIPGSGSGFTPVNPDITPTGSQDTLKAKQQDTGSRHRDILATNRVTRTSDPRAVQQSAASLSDNSGSSTTDSLFPSPSNRSTAATSLNADVPPTAMSVPSIDDQIAQVTALWQKELEEGQKGYLISAKWFQKVQARGSVPADVGKIEKSATEGEIGPVDNSDIAMVIDEEVKLTDEAGEKYVPLRPGLTLDEDYRVFPQEAWDLIISWYGLAKDSPVITRYAHDWSGADAAMPNVTWELNPPLFSFLKVPSEHTTQTQREKDLPPQRMIASKKTLCNDWLKEGKKLLHIDMNTKVRVWRILGGLKNATASGGLTPSVSRSASPAPGVEIVATAGDKMLLDVNTFIHLQVGEHRELLTEIKDNTANPNYNGKTLTLSLVGLGRNEEVIVLEEQKSGKEEWPSESSKLNLTKGIKGAAKSLTPSGRSSPAPGMMTRGRQKRDGRPRGITGLSNLGNTCYMNSALQCIRSVEELTQFFLHDQWKQDLNVDNPLGHHGEIAKAYANLLHQIYDENASSTNPSRFKATIGKYGSSFSGYQQQDSQEFLLFLLDGLQEDLNRIHKKPYIEKPDSTDEMVQDSAALQAFAQKNWEIYKARNDSVVTDLFAGMYKSTLTCPVCNKVSIIFDPFNNLTLQLPIENNWQKEILYFPLHKRPIRIDIDIDKHSTIKALKEFVALRTHADVERLLVAESYKNKIYKIFDNNIVISEANIQVNDIICMYELESVPTNYNPNKARKFSLYMVKSDADDDLVEGDSPEADRLLVPMYNRLVKAPASRVSSKPFFGQPMYLVLSREDRSTYDGVLKKILGNVTTMTTKRILDEEDNPSEDGVGTPEGSDTMVMTDDMSSSGSGLPTANSVQGEDGLVDVSMRDASQAPELRPQPADASFQKLLQSNSPIPRRFQQLFDVQVASTGEGIPTGWNQISESTEYESIKNRIPKPVSRPARSAGTHAFANGESGSAESDDELADVENDDTPMDSNDSGSEASPVLPSGPDSESELPEPQEILPSRNKKAHKYGKNKNRGKLSGRRAQRRSPLPPPQPLPKAQTGDLIRPGEAIILDWTQDGYDALFGGNEDGSEGFRGLPTWKGVGILPDPEIAAKREQRNSRKKHGITLVDCLNEFGKSETLSEQNAWYCPRCKEHRRADKMFELWKAPDILVMHLKRFSSNRNFRDKLEVRVDYPTEGLDLSEMVRDQQDGKSLIYDLIAVDNHYGGLGGGHYTAYAKNFYNNSWYEYNDSHVSSKTDPKSVVTSAAYLLFYRRRSDHPLGGPKLQELLEESATNSNDVAADSELPQDSRDSSPMTGEGRRLGDSSHNGSSSAFPVGHGHRVGAGPGGSALGEGSRQNQGLLAGTESPPSLMLPTAASSGGEYEQPPGYDDAPAEADVDEGVGMDFQWSQQTWDFARLETSTQRAPANSEEEGMFGDKGSSNDSTRVEGNDCSPAPSFPDLEDAGSIHHDPNDIDIGLYSSDAGPVMHHEDFRPGRATRESAPPPDEIASGIGTSGRGMSKPVNMKVHDDNDDDDLPVMELQADPANNNELRFNPAA